MSDVWPIDLKAEYERRMKIIIECEKDAALRSALMVYYAANPIDWICDFAVTYDPRAKGAKIIPFILFRRQREFIQFLQECLRDKESGLIEKSRDIGATWLCCAFSVWLLLLHPGSSIGWGSRDEDTVDQKGNPDSIFEKMRMILDNLPAWMLPAGFNPTNHCKFMNIVNTENNSSVKGDAGSNIGRGGRSQIFFKDESAHYENAEKIEAALGDNTDCQIDISSVNGTANIFYRRRMAGEIWSPGCTIEKGKVRVFIFDWRDHPAKDQNWYDNRRKKYEAEGLLHILAQEVDRDYAGAVLRTLIPAQWVRAAIDAHVKLGFQDDGEKIAGLDVADEGADKNAITIRHGVVLKEVACWGEGDVGESARKGYALARQLGCSELNYDCIGVGAGVKAETNRMISENIIPATFKVLPWNAGSSPENAELRMIPDDIDSPLIGDFFLNRKAQAYWSLRGRFERTFKAVTQGVKYDSAELISLPSDLPLLHQLCNELSQPVWSQNGKGKMIVDKKPNGAMSPNLADSLVMCFFPMREWEAGIGYLQYMKEQVQRDKAEALVAMPKPAPIVEIAHGVMVQRDNQVVDYTKLLERDRTAVFAEMDSRY